MYTPKKPPHKFKTNRPSSISIFNTITVNPVIKQDNEEKKDSVADCFKSIFSCFKRK